jgi:hypothetical protein
MPIADDFTIDYVDRKITYSTAFVDDRPPTIYTVNELYSFLQDTFDEPAQMDDPIPMSAQTPTQYTLLYPWFIDNESMKALYGGSIQTSGWAEAGASEGITALRWANAPTSAPDASDIGTVATGGTSTATGVILAVDTVRQIVWVRNTSATQFQSNENVTTPSPSADFNTETTRGFQSGNSIWSKPFSVGTVQDQTEIYVGQDDDQLGGTAFHDADADSRFERRQEKIDEWWDSDVDFTASPNGVATGHFDILVLTTELGIAIDAGRLAVYARQFGTVYSHFEFIGGVGNFVVPFASTGADLNAQDGPYTVAFDARSGADLEVGDVLENTTGAGSNAPEFRLRAVVTAVTGGASATGTFDYYLIGDTEPLTTTDRTLIQLADNDNLKVRGDTTLLDVNGAVTLQGPALAQGITITFADAQRDIDEDTVNEEYACVINCNNVPLADVYKRVQFLTARGNQDGTVADTQDTLLPGGGVTDEASEFYRGVGDIIFNYDGGQGTQPTEGDLVVGSISGAYGVVTSITAGTTGICVLTGVKGTFVDNDVVAEIDAAASNDVTINEPTTGPVALVDNTSAPFGTFAGGRWFVAQGVVLDNVPASDANNWQTVDLEGNTITPPAVRTITFAGLVANDRAAIFEVITAGGIDVQKNQNGVGAGGAAISDVSIPMDTTVALDVPPTGWVRIVDTSAAALGTEYRYEYSAVSGTTITLRPVAPDPGTCTSAGTSTVLNDTGQFTTFGTDGQVKIGHEIRNISTGGIATVLRKIDNNSIETTPLSTGIWGNTDTYEVNQVVVALVDADTLYFPFIDDVASGTSIAKTIKFVSITEVVARMRFSDPDIGGTRQLPFEQLGQQITDADLTITAIRTADPIAS